MQISSRLFPLSSDLSMFITSDGSNLFMFGALVVAKPKRSTNNAAQLFD